MARPTIDNTQLPPLGPHLRYARVYSVADHVALVKLLVWSGSAFVVYGSPFVIVGTFQSSDVGKDIWIIWRSDAQGWLEIAGSTAEKPRAIVGAWYASVDDEHFKIDNIVVLDSGTDPRIVPGDPDEQITIRTLNDDNYGDGDMVWADYDETDGYWIARPKAGSANLIPVLVHKAVPGATKSGAGPTITPTSIWETDSNIEKLEENTSGDLEPSGEFLDVIYRGKDAIPAPDEGQVWNGEVLESNGKKVLLIVYCEPWHVSSGGDD